MRSQVEGLFGRLNTLIASHKTDGPTSILTFLGIEIDTDQFQLRPPVCEDFASEFTSSAVGKATLLYAHGFGILAWSFIPCSYCYQARTHLPCQPVFSVIGGVAPITLHSTECQSQNRSRLVALSNEALEWAVLLPSARTIRACLLGCLRLLWMRCVLWQLLVSGTMAQHLGKH